MAEQLLDGADVIARLQHMRGEGVTQAVAGRWFGDARNPDRTPKYPLHDGRVQVVKPEDTGAGIDVLPRRREHPMPAQLPRRPWVLPLEGIRKGDGSGPRFKPGRPDHNRVNHLAAI